MELSDGGVLLLGVSGVTLAAVLFEGWRQRRVYGKPSGRSNLAGAGMLELQRHLQADRDVGKLVEVRRDESAETERDEAGGPRRPPAPSS